MPTKEWKCLECSKKFGPDNFMCTDGTSLHVVEQKEYLLADAPSDPGHPASGGMDSRRDGRTRICNIPPDRTVLRNGESMLVPGGYVEFIRGRFSTNNPEIQYYLEKKGGFCTEGEWAAAWLSQSQQLEMREMALKAREQRIESTENALLSKTKERVGAGA